MPGFEMVPEQNMNKRPASQDAGTRPDARPRKGLATTGAGRDVTSMGSAASVEAPEIFTSESSHAAAIKAENTPVPGSQQRPTRSHNRSMKSVVIEADLLDHMLTLLLQSSRRLNDLEATNYYTHVIPTKSDMCMEIDKVYQGYLVTVQKNKEHNLGPPTIHRGMALLKQVLLNQESMQENTGLKAMWPVVLSALNAMNSEDMDIAEAAKIIGHCKINTMFDKENTKLVFVMPQIVDCGGKATTLGSVVSRLLRSMGFERKTGVAPPGFLERKIKETLDNHRL
jgi:hypothetical protein